MPFKIRATVIWGSCFLMNEDKWCIKCIVKGWQITVQSVRKVKQLAECMTVNIWSFITSHKTKLSPQRVKLVLCVRQWEAFLRPWEKPLRVLPPAMSEGDRQRCFQQTAGEVCSSCYQSSGFDANCFKDNVINIIMQWTYHKHDNHNIIHTAVGMMFR